MSGDLSAIGRWCGNGWLVLDPVYETSLQYSAHKSRPALSEFSRRQPALPAPMPTSGSGGDVGRGSRRKRARSRLNARESEVQARHEGVRDVLLRAHAAFMNDPGTTWSWCPQGENCPNALHPSSAAPPMRSPESAPVACAVHDSQTKPALDGTDGPRSALVDGRLPSAPLPVESSLTGGADSGAPCDDGGQKRPMGKDRTRLRDSRADRQGEVRIMSCEDAGGSRGRGGKRARYCRFIERDADDLVKHAADEGADDNDGEEELGEKNEEAEGEAAAHCHQGAAHDLANGPQREEHGGMDEEAPAALDLVAMAERWQASLVECRVCYGCALDPPSWPGDAGCLPGTPLASACSAAHKDNQPTAPLPLGSMDTSAQQAAPQAAHPFTAGAADACRSRAQRPWTKLFRSLVENPSEGDALLEIDARPGLALVMPPRSSFFMSDIRDIHALIPEPPQPGFALIVADPPWENKSAARQGPYATLPSRYLLSIPMRRLAHATCGALLALWVTNRGRLRRFVEDELFPAWGVTHVATWHWLKIAQDGSLLSPLDNPHHKPYEPVLLGWVGPNASSQHTHAEEAQGAAASGPVKDGCARCSCQWAVQEVESESAEPSGPSSASACASTLCQLVAGVPDNLVIISPPRQHSRKPHLGRLLRHCLPAGRGDIRQLELFARELNAGWLSWGNEPVKFQSLDHFL